MDEQGHQLPAVLPQPVPTSFNIAQVSNNRGEIMAQIAVSTPTGTFVVYADGETAKALGEILQKIGTMSGSGLLMP